MEEVWYKIKRNKMIYILVVCIFSLIISIGCAKKDEYINIEDSNLIENASDQEDVSQNEEKSVIIVSSNWPPYEFEQNMEIKGIGVDIAEEAFKRMGYKTTKKILPFSRAIEMLEKGEIDMITDVKNTVERQKIGIFSNEPILTTYTSLFVKGDSDIKFTGNIYDLRGYKIGIVRDYTYGSKFDSAVENDLLNIEKADNYQQNIDKILDNRLDILIENRLVVLNALKISENEGEIKELNPTLSETPVYAWFTKKKNLETMINEFDKKILEIKQDGTFEKIYESYTNEESKR